MRQWALDRIDKAAKEMEAELIPAVAEVFDSTYAALPPDLAKQKAVALEKFKGK